MAVFGWHLMLIRLDWMHAHLLGVAQIANGSTLWELLVVYGLKVSHQISSYKKLWIPTLIGSVAIRYFEFSGFRLIFGQSLSHNPSITTGLALQFRLQQESAPQTTSKAISLQFVIRKSPPPMNR